MRDQERSIDAHRLASSRLIPALDSSKSRDQTSTTKGDTGGDSDWKHISNRRSPITAQSATLTLAQKVEPPCDPREERRRALGGRQHRRPEIRPSARRVRGRDFGHAEPYEESEDADDDPADRHDARSAGREAVFEQCRDACDDALGGKGWYIASLVRRHETRDREWRVAEEKEGNIGRQSEVGNSNGVIRTMMENDTPKLCISVQLRFNSCLYPCSASVPSSVSSGGGVRKCGNLSFILSALAFYLTLVRYCLPIQS